MRKLISLGESCEVAFQLRQHSGDNAGHYFDWLATPIDGLLHVIRNDFPAFRPENLSLQRGGDRLGYVSDAKTGINFSHQFPRRGNLIPPDFLKDYPPFAGKFEHLAGRFRDTVRGQPVCLVRRIISRPQALHLEEAMRRLFPTADMQFLYVNADAEPFETPLGRSVLFERQQTGFGNSIAWARLLVSEGLVAQPFRLATAQIVRSSANDHHFGERDRHSATVLATALRANPENPWFAHELGTQALARRRFRRAAKLAAMALVRDPENRDFRELALRARLGARQVSRDAALAESLALLDRASRPGMWELAADLAIARQSLDETLDLIGRGLENHPDAEGLHWRKARVLLAVGRAPEADAAVDIALALHPAGKASVEIKAKILCALGRPNEAYLFVREVLRSKRSYRLKVLRALLALRLVGRLPRKPPILVRGSRGASLP